MSPRSIRRAAEHKARKLAAKQQRLEQSPTASENLVSRGENPGICTGPRTPEGKAISSMNALRTGLTGRTVLLSSDDADVYASHIEQYRAEFLPVGIRETELVQSLADTSWRLRRIPGLEIAIYAQGRCEFANYFDDRDPSLRASLIELQTHLKYEKNLRNLQLQESRLTRRYTNELKELRTLQRDRADKLAPETPRRNAQSADGPGAARATLRATVAALEANSRLSSDQPVSVQAGVASQCGMQPPTQFDFSTSHQARNATAAIVAQTCTANEKGDSFASR